MVASTRKGVALWVFSVLLVIFAEIAAPHVEAVYIDVFNKEMALIEAWVMMVACVVAIILSLVGAAKFAKHQAI